MVPRDLARELGRRLDVVRVERIGFGLDDRHLQVGEVVDRVGVKRLRDELADGLAGLEGDDIARFHLCHRRKREPEDQKERNEEPDNTSGAHEGL